MNHENIKFTHNNSNNSTENHKMENQKIMNKQNLFSPFWPQIIFHISYPLMALFYNHSTPSKCRSTHSF